MSIKYKTEGKLILTPKTANVNSVAAIWEVDGKSVILRSDRDTCVVLDQEMLELLMTNSRDIWNDIGPKKHPVAEPA